MLKTAKGAFSLGMVYIEMGSQGLSSVRCFVFNTGNDNEVTFLKSCAVILSDWHTMSVDSYRFTEHKNSCFEKVKILLLRQQENHIFR